MKLIVNCTTTRADSVPAQCAHGIHGCGQIKAFTKGRRADDEKGQIESTVRENNEEGRSAEPNCAN